MKTGKPDTVRVIAASLLALIAVVCLVGCRSVGYKTGDATAKSLHEASRAVQNETAALNATIGSLANLVNSPAPDLKPQFKEYSATLDQLVDSVEKTDKSFAKLRQRGADYLSAWDAELDSMNYEIIRSSSADRKMAVSNQLAAICERYEEAQAVVRPFIIYFADIQRSLGTDLTADGLAAAREVVRRAEENTQKVQIALEQLGNELSASGARLSSVISTGEPLTATGRPESSRRTQMEAGLH